MAFQVTCKIAQPIQPIWQHIFALSASVLKKPPWEFNFFHIFGIPSSSRHEKCCQILQTLFWVFQYSRNSQCEAKRNAQPQKEVCLRRDLCRNCTRIYHMPVFETFLNCILFRENLLCIRTTVRRLLLEPVAEFELWLFSFSDSRNASAILKSIKKQ